MSPELCLPLIDTHNHLQVESFERDRETVVRRAGDAGVACALVAGGSPLDWEKCVSVARGARWCAGLGVHPLATASAEVTPESGEILRDALRKALSEPGSPVVAVAEIGLDGYVAGLDWKKQEEVFASQLKVARDFGLPVSLHVRRSVDQVAKWLRRIPVPGGVAHAFNGSEEQARVFIGLGLKLGFGGAMTYSGSRRIRHLAATLPLGSIVLETDSPDMPSSSRRDAGALRTEPSDIASYLGILSELRRVPASDLAPVIYENSLNAFPLMRRILGARTQAEGPER